MSTRRELIDRIVQDTKELRDLCTTPTQVERYEQMYYWLALLEYAIKG